MLLINQQTRSTTLDLWHSAELSKHLFCIKCVKTQQHSVTQRTLSTWQRVCELVAAAPLCSVRLRAVVRWAWPNCMGHIISSGYFKPSSAVGWRHLVHTFNTGICVNHNSYKKHTLTHSHLRTHTHTHTHWIPPLLPNHLLPVPCEALCSFVGYSSVAIFIWAMLFQTVIWYIPGQGPLVTIWTQNSLAVKILQTRHDANEGIN